LDKNNGCDIFIIPFADRQKTILKLLKEKSRISGAQLSEKLGINPPAVQKHLEKLKSQGLLKKLATKSGYWEIIEKK